MKGSEQDAEADRWSGTSGLCVALVCGGAFVAGQPTTVQVMVKGARRDANAARADKVEGTVAKH